MTDTKFTALARKLTALAVLVALMATVYAFGASTPQEAVASSHNVEYVSPNWSLKPSGLFGGDQFRLIFYSATKRDAESDDIADYNMFVQERAAVGHADIQLYSDEFTAVGCTPDDDARDNTRTRYTNSNRGVPIYWLNGTKVADDYRDFYDGSWDNEANDRDRNEHGNTGPNSSLLANFPWTGCENNGTEAFNGAGDVSQALGTPDEYVRVGRPNSITAGNGPLSDASLTEEYSDEHPMYGISQVFTVVPGNPGTLTTGGTPRTGTIGTSDSVGQFQRVKLHQNVKYRIDVKGSESSQYGGTITNPQLKLIAGSDDITLLNDSDPRVSQTKTATDATGGGGGQNSRLDIKVTGETKYYYLLVHRDAGDDGSYTITVNRLDWPQGRLAPDIEVTRENRTGLLFTWDEPAKTHDSISAPISGYKVQYRTRPDGGWSAETTKTATQLTHEYRNLTPGQKYEVRVRSYHSDPHPNNTYQWGYATVHTDDCAESGANTCDISVNSSKKGRINYNTSDDLDGYTVRLTGGTTYVIKANGKSSNNGTLVDPDLTLTRISNNAIASNNDGGKGLNSKITHAPPSTGDYLIKVSSHVTGERGSYRVKVTEK